MIAVVVYIVSLISLSASLQDDLPILSQFNCSGCPSVYVPVCTDDERTFVNECRLDCYNEKLQELKRPMVNLAYYGTCVSTFVQVGVQVPENEDTDTELF